MTQKTSFKNALIIFYKKAISPEFELNLQNKHVRLCYCTKFMVKETTRHKKIVTSLKENHIEITANEDFEARTSISLKDYLKQKLLELGEPCLSILTMHTYQKLNMAIITEKMGYANEHTTRQQKYKCLKRIRKMIPEEEKNSYLECSNEFNHIEAFEAYYNNELSAHAIIDFEERLESDDEFKNEYAIYLQLQEAIEEHGDQQLKSFIRKYDAEYVNSKQKTRLH